MKKARKIILIAGGSVVGLIAVTALLGVLYAARGIDFPPLSGHYKVGKTLMEIVDQSREEIFTSDPNDNRDLVLTVYYPASPAAGARPSPRVQGQTADVMAKTTGIPRFILSSFNSQSYGDAPLARDGAPYPVLVFSQGFAGQLPPYSSLLEEVSSHGYVVVCISHPYTDAYVVYPDRRVAYMNDAGGNKLNYADREPGLFPNRKAYVAEMEKILNVWTDDTIFTVNKLEEINGSHGILAGSMDLAALGIFGHSFGGSTAIDAMLRDRRIRAGIDMEGAILGEAATRGIRQPVLIMETPTYAPREFVFAGSLQKLLESSERCYLMGIHNAGHVSFVTDVPFVVRKFGGFVRQDVGTIDPRRSYDIITCCTVQFFDQELKGVHSELLDEKNITVFMSMKKYPEASIRSYTRQ